MTWRQPMQSVIASPRLHSRYNVRMTVTDEFQKILPKMICFVAMLVCFFNCNMCPMPASTTNSQVLSIIQLMSCISNTLMNGLHVVDLQMMSGTTSVPSMRIFVGMLFVPQLSSSIHFMPQNKVRSSNTISMYCISSSS